MPCLPLRSGRVSAGGRTPQPCTHPAGFRASTLRVQAMAHESHNALHRPAPPPKPMHSFFYFDPQDPEQVVEHRAAGAGTSHQAPLHLVPSSRSSSRQLANHEDVGTSQKALVMQQELMAQLEHTRSKVLELQQFESTSREWRMRAQQAAAELVLFQRTLADKDAELASAYKRLESAAAERSALRKLNLALDEEARSLKGVMDEVRLLEAASLGDKGAPAAGARATAAQIGEAAGKAADTASGAAKSGSGSNNGKVAGAKRQ